MSFNYRLFKQAGRPQVGPWWYYKGQVHGVSEPAPYPLNYSYSDLTHNNLWPQMGLPGYEYTAQERGRVESTPEGFIIFTSKNVAKDKNAINQVIKRYSLPVPLTRVVIDKHHNRTVEDEMYEMMMAGDENDYENDYESDDEW